MEGGGKRVKDYRALYEGIFAILVCVCVFWLKRISAQFQTAQSRTSLRILSSFGSLAELQLCWGGGVLLK